MTREKAKGVGLSQTVDEGRRALDLARHHVLSRPGFASRSQAIDHLEVHVLDRLLGEPEAVLSSAAQELRTDAESQIRRFHSANARVVRRLRRHLAAGRCGPERLTRILRRVADSTLPRRGYDSVDELVSGLLDVGAVPEEQHPREPEMVFYQATPARAALRLVEVAGIGPGDVVCDLGSGLGRVVILVSLLTAARAVGIEVDPAYVEYARRSARRLNVRGVDFLCADARNAPLSDATVFFMYTPFRGALLGAVLERLRGVAAARPIRVCTYGPCTAEVARVDWLKPNEGAALSEHALAVFHSR